MVRHAELRMYTIALQKFEEFQKNVRCLTLRIFLSYTMHSALFFQVNATAPKFRDDEFVQLLAFQIDQFRGRELPGFMSSQAFYMCISEYVDQWCDPMQKLLEEVKLVAFHVATKLADVMLVQYPGLKQTLGKIVDEILETTCKKARDIVVEMLNREKDPFTLNDFLQQWVNKIRFDRFSVAVEETFDKARSPSNNWGALKEEVFEGMRSWYRTTHCVSAIASAQDMSAIMEAYWHLSAKRFVDNCCMITDKEMLNTLPAAVQDLMYPFIKNDEMLEVSFFFHLIGHVIRFMSVRLFSKRTQKFYVKKKKQKT